jgi:NAD(P)H-quinone oxidoreductase subunit 4
MADILLAAVATTRLSITAAILQMISHGLISALLFLLVGVVYKSCSRDVDYLRRFIKSRKRFTNHGNVNDFSGYGSCGIPGMVGFIAEFLVFRGSFPIFPIQTLLCLVASGLTAVYFLLMINRVFFGRLTPELSAHSRSTWRKISRNCFGFIYYCSGITTELDDSLE